MSDTPVLDAFWAYERALMADDVAALAAAFAPGPDSLRGDAAGVLAGQDAIAAFRGSRGGAPQRRILDVEVRHISDDAALTLAITAPDAGGRGLVTQLWRRIGGRWLIAAAQVASPSRAIDPSIWRTVGTPLVAGLPGGPLSGQTVAVKDLYAIAGHPIGAGVPAYLAEAPVEAITAPAVQALLDAGADVIGIARTDEFAYSIAGRNPHYGTPPNPAVPGGVPGGSSNGPAAAVASGQASLGLATDTAGSIRIPASYQGLWGLRTTHGAIDPAGVLPLAPSFDAVGWLTRTPEVLREAVRASLPQQAEAGAFAVAPALLDVVEPDVRAAFQGFLAGIEAEEIELPSADELFATFRTIQAAEAWRAWGGWIGAHPGALGEDIAGRFAAASEVTGEQETAARRRWIELRGALDGALGGRTLLLPSASSSAPATTADAELIERTRQGTLRLTAVAGLTGRPALSVPLLGVPRPGALLPAPVGVCLVGPQLSELALLNLAETLAP